MSEVGPVTADPRFKVEGGPPGTRFEVRRFAEVDSTNRYLVDLARSASPTASPGRTCIVAVAGHQTAGRGRLGRRWEAPAGDNLLLSVLLMPDMPMDQLHLCTAAVALAGAAACEVIAGVEVGLKWPNDLMVGERKLGGILAESVPTGDRRAVIVGLGCNVRWPPPDGVEPGPKGGVGELSMSATSLWREASLRAASASPDAGTASSEAAGIKPDPSALCCELLSHLEPLIDQLDDRAGRLRIAGEFRGKCTTLGRRVRITRVEGDIEGVATDITPEGHLVVDQGACFATVTAGDVIHLRPQG